MKKVPVMDSVSKREPGYNAMRLITPVKIYVARLIRFSRLSSGRGLMLESAFWLTLSRLAIAIMPFRWIAPHLGTQTTETSGAINQHERDLFRMISRTVERAARKLPWECTCLVQAMAGKAMLGRRSVPSTLYLGLAKDEKNQLYAHAWLRCGDKILIGGPGSERFTVISAFGDETRPQNS